MRSSKKARPLSHLSSKNHGQNIQNHSQNIQNHAHNIQKYQIPAHILVKNYPDCVKVEQLSSQICCWRYSSGEQPREGQEEEKEGVSTKKTRSVFR